MLPTMLPRGDARRKSRPLCDLLPSTFSVLYALGRVGDPQTMMSCPALVFQVVLPWHGRMEFRDALKQCGLALRCRLV
ncbi:unnamed protein product [Ixodes pacificus]